jgi:hypothetical protein
MSVFTPARMSSSKHTAAPGQPTPWLTSQLHAAIFANECSIFSGERQLSGAIELLGDSCRSARIAADEGELRNILRFHL